MRKVLALTAIVLISGAAAVWWLWPQRQPGSSPAPSSGQLATESGRPLLGLVLADDQVKVWYRQTPILLQVDFVDLPEESASGTDRRMISWDGLTLIQRKSTGHEAEITFDFLSLSESDGPPQFGKPRTSFREIGIPPGVLEIGQQTLIVRLTEDGIEPFTSNPLTIEVGSGSMSPSERALWSARYQLDLDRPQKALDVLDAALSDDPSHADLHGLRGQTLERQGDVRGAVDAYSKALELLADRDHETFEPPAFYFNRRRALIETLNRRRPPS